MSEELIDAKSHVDGSWRFIFNFYRQVNFLDMFIPGPTTSSAEDQPSLYQPE